MLGEQITAGQLKNRECITMYVHDMKITMRFIWALQHNTMREVGINKFYKASKQSMVLISFEISLPLS
jgi:hypothetical protein